MSAHYFLTIAVEPKTKESQDWLLGVHLFVESWTPYVSQLNDDDTLTIDVTYDEFDQIEGQLITATSCADEMFSHLEKLAKPLGGQLKRWNDGDK